jgi:acetyl esterase/lipase
MKTSALVLSAAAMVLAHAYSPTLLNAQDPAAPAATPATAAESQISEAPVARVVKDRQMQAVLDELTALNGKPIETLTPDLARLQPTPFKAVASLMQKGGIKKEEVGTVVDRNLLVDGKSLPARIYTPVGDGPFPIILYVHGGGWVLGDLDTYDASARALTNAVGAIVVSPDYRRAPEAKFPAGHEDVSSTYEWIYRNGGTIRGDVNRIAVAGESAGANMALAVSFYARERAQPMPIHQLLIYPVADMTGADTASYREHANARPLNKAMMGWFARHALAKPADARDPKISPVLAGEALAGLPPTTIINAEIDPLRSDGETLSALLSRAGVKVNRKVYEGVTHEFFGMGAVVDQARDAVQFAANDLRAAFERVNLPPIGESPAAAAANPAPAAGGGTSNLPAPSGAPTTPGEGR